MWQSFVFLSEVMCEGDALQLAFGTLLENAEPQQSYPKLCSEHWLIIRWRAWSDMAALVAIR